MSTSIGRLGSTATMEDSVVSSQFGSQSGSELGSRDSLDYLDGSSRIADKEDNVDNVEEDDDQGYVPEPTREVISVIYLMHQSICNKKHFICW